MGKSIKLVMLAAFCSLFIVSGCTHIPGGVASSTVPLDGKEYDIIGPVMGRDVRVYVLGIIPISDSNDTREAIDSALKKSGGDALINVSVEYASRYWIFWKTSITKVFGHAIKFK